jgi:hypothetical protein
MHHQHKLQHFLVFWQLELKDSKPQEVSHSKQDSGDSKTVQWLHRVDKFIYFGSEINSKGKINGRINRRSNKMVVNSVKL